MTLRGLLRRLKSVRRDNHPVDPVVTMMNQGLITVGRKTYPNPPPVITFNDARTRVHIGSFTSMAAGVQILCGGEHRTDWVTTSPLRILYDLPGASNDGHPHTKGDITIGNDVWIGTSARIMSGVTIGDGAVIGAGAVVTRDVGPYEIVAGLPARHVRFRFSEDIIRALLRIRWWDWPEDVVIDRVADLCSTDIETFVERYDRDHRDGTRRA